MRRRIAAAVAVLLVLSAGAAVYWLRPGPDAGVPQTPAAAEPWRCSAPCDRFAIAWGGDTFLGWAAAREIQKHGMPKVLQGAKELIAGDYAIVNVESPWTTLGKGEAPDDPGNFYSYNADPATAADLAAIGVDAVGLANNHTFDRGSQGVLDSVRHATEAGMTAFGSGANEGDAGAPLLIPTPHGVVGVVALATGKKGAAGPAQAGYLRLTEANAKAGVERARAEGARWVVAFVHWGSNYAPLDRSQPVLARKLAAAGFDLVVGTGPHVAQPVGIVDGVPVLYSLGNFAFHTKGRFEKLGMPSESYTAVTYLGPDGFEAAELRCFDGDNRANRFRTPPCKPEQAVALWTRLGGLVQPRGDVGVVRF